MANFSDGDPWYWETPTLIQELCKDKRFWQGRPASKLPDTESLASSIEEHAIDGETLLKWGDLFGNVDGLFSDLCIKKIPHRLSLQEAIVQMKTQSSVYKLWKDSVDNGVEFTVPPPAHKPMDKRVAQGSLPQANVAPITRQSTPAKETSDLRSRHQSVTSTPRRSKGQDEPHRNNKNPTPSKSVTAPTHHQAQIENDDDDDEDDEPHRPKKRRAVLQNLSAQPINKKPVELPTEADNIHFKVLPTINSDIAELWKDALPGTYLGQGRLIVLSSALEDDPEPASTSSPSDDKENNEFSWARTARLPPGRNLQVNKACKVLFVKNNAKVSRINQGLAPLVESESQSEEVLPLFGESDDDEDEQTYEEVMQEEREREAMAKAKKLYLDRAQVEEILDNARRDFEAGWVEKKLPRYENKARKIWTAAIRSRTRHHQVRKADEQIPRLNVRLQKIRDEILAQPWLSDAEVRRQTGSMEQSVHDHLYQSWLFRTLSSLQAPPKPNHDRQKTEKAPVEVGENDEVLTSESEQEMDFIVDDDEPEDFAAIEYDDPETCVIPKEDTLNGASHHNKPTNTMAAQNPSRSPWQEDLSHEVIDLTMLDDVDDEDPVVDLITPSRHTGSLALKKTEKQDEDPDLNIPFSEASRIAEKGRKFWKKAGDKFRLVIAKLQRMTPDHRAVFFAHFDNNEPANTLFHELVRKPLTSEIQPELEIEHMLVPKIFYSYCYLDHRRKMRTNETTTRLLDAHNRFAKFREFIKEIRPYFIKPVKAAPVAAESVGEEENEEVEAEEEEEEEDDDIIMEHISDGDEEELLGAAKNGKQRKVDQEAYNMRLRQQERVRQQQEKARLLHETIAASSGVSSDKTRLIINESKQDNQGLIYVHDHIAGRIKDHQVSGVRFMWNQIVLDDNDRQGCLLAHTMGLGKTMQIITLLSAIAEAAQSPDPSIFKQIPKELRKSKTLVLCPSGLVDNWIDELYNWAPADLLGDYFKIESADGIQERSRQVIDWGIAGGVLVIGYDLFKNFVQEEESETFKHLIEGPNIVVADEAHKLKNPMSGVSRAAARFKTQSRIALTGSPLANNVEEYWAMIDWVAPNYLGPLQEFRQSYADPIHTGLWGDSNKADRKTALRVLNALRKLVAPKLHRATMQSSIRDDLPPKLEFVLTIPLTALQRKLYDCFVQHTLQDRVKGSNSQAQVFAVVNNLGLICNHPRCFRVRCEEEKRKQIASEAQTRILTEPLVADGLRLTQGRDIDQPEMSWKVTLVMKVLDMCREAGDKVLIFSQYISTLDYLENLLRQERRHVSRLDGQTAVKLRQSRVKTFNNGVGEVFLISTGAGGVGLNIFGANRVIIFDFKWNPVDEQQAVGRAYRIGQTKTVYVYRFVTGGTFEDVLQNKAVFKMQLASRVVDKTNPIAWSKRRGEILTAARDPERKDVSMYTGKDKVLDGILLDPTLRKVVYSIVETDTFEEEDLEGQLTADDHKAVDNMVEMAVKRRTDPEGYRKLMEQNMGAFGAASAFSESSILGGGGGTSTFGPAYHFGASTFGALDTTPTTTPPPSSAPPGVNVGPRGFDTTSNPAMTTGTNMMVPNHSIAASTRAANGHVSAFLPSRHHHHQLPTSLQDIDNGGSNTISGLDLHHGVPNATPMGYPPTRAPLEDASRRAVSANIGNVPSSQPVGNSRGLAQGVGHILPMMGANTHFGGGVGMGTGGPSTGPFMNPPPAAINPAAAIAIKPSLTTGTNEEEFRDLLHKTLTTMPPELASLVPGNMEEVSSRVTDAIRKVRRSKSQGYLPDVNQWSLLRSQLDGAAAGNLFAAAVASGYLTPDYLATVKKPELIQMMSDFGKTSVADFPAMMLRRIDKTHDPNHLDNYLRQNFGLSAAKAPLVLSSTAKEQRKKDDSLVMQQVYARRRAQKRPALPGWAADAVANPPSQPQSPQNPPQSSSSSSATGKQ